MMDKWWKDRWAWFIHHPIWWNDWMTENSVPWMPLMMQFGFGIAEYVKPPIVV